MNNPLDSMNNHERSMKIPRTINRNQLKSTLWKSMENYQTQRGKTLKIYVSSMNQETSQIFEKLELWNQETSKPLKKYFGITKHQKTFETFEPRSIKSL